MTDISPYTPESKPEFLSQPLLSTINLDWEKTIYIGLIFFAILTRFWDLGSRVMSHDESLHTQFSYQFYNGDGYNHTPLMHGPFLFHITAVSYWLFGDNDFTARVPVALFGVFLVFFPYFFRHWLGRLGAIFTSFIFLISPYITYYSRYIRHDIYVIVWALIVFFSIWSYLKNREEKYLWSFAASTALMFSTKEVSFIYVAIFGSFLIIRLLVNLISDNWFKTFLPKLRTPILIALAGVLLFIGGLIGQRSTTQVEPSIETREATEGFAVDPNQPALIEEAQQPDNIESIMRWIQIAGISVLSLGLFLSVRKMRPRIDEHPEFDLIILFTTLILPSISPFITVIAGWNPRDYTINSCVLEGQEGMNALQLLMARMGQPLCWSSFFSSGVVRSGVFLIITLVVAILIGLWWNNRRWLISAAIFHSIFAVLFTSVFTNPAGWTSGTIGSLGYWLEQQAVERGSQPLFYYFFVTPFYEFLAVIFFLVGVRYWMIKKRVNKIAGYWLTLFLSSYLVFSFAKWLFNISAVQQGDDPNLTPGFILSLIVIGAGTLYWIFARRRQLLVEYELVSNFQGLVDLKSLVGFVPSIIWWMIINVVAYSYAGEKMPWLSTHFVIPMALMSGWYFNEKLKNIQLQSLISRSSLQLLGLTIVLIVAGLLALGPLLLGKVQFSNLELENLSGTGRFLGTLVVFVGIYYVWRLIYQKIEAPVRNRILILSVFTLLSLLTIRFSYMASFPNADYTNEFLVYAHGAPATKNIIMDQVEELSMRLYGDKSIKVAFSQDTSWPFTWYLREYPNRVFYGENPSHSLTESPIILTGNLDWAKTEPYLGNDYETRTYTYLWWPMEEYRKITWGAIFGDPNMEVRRGLGNSDVRQALWDIFFYRDYKKYGEVFGGNYTAGQWPLRHEMRLYIRRDVLADLWDYGIAATGVEARVDPYAENALQLSPIMVINEGGLAGFGEGGLFAPRNVDVGPDGRIYVADSGNHRIEVFEADGTFIRTWGSSGSELGFFNEPWDLAVDESHVYVADTWNHRIQKFTLDGQFVAVFGQSGSPGGDQENTLGLFFGPRDILFLDNDLLLVTDTGNHRMQVLDKEGNFIRQVGSFGNLLGQLNEPVGLGMGRDGFVYLADTWNSRIQQFSPQLVAINEWFVDAWDGQSTNNKPYLTVDSAGRIYVTDPEGYRVLIFSNQGDYLGRFGTFGTDINGFSLPNGITIDDNDNIYIADAGNNRILKFAPVFGAPQTLPQEIDVLPSNDNSGEGNIGPVDGDVIPVENVNKNDSQIESENSAGNETINPTPMAENNQNDQ